MGWIYFIQGAAGGPIKIGLSRNPEKRLAALRAVYPDRDLVIRRTISVHEGTIYRAEKVVHKQFGAYRIEGEWFRPAPELARVAQAISE